MSSRDGRVCDSGLVDSNGNGNHRRPRLENDDIANMMFGKNFGAPKPPSSVGMNMPSYQNEPDNNNMPNLGAPNVSMGAPSNYVPESTQYMPQKDSEDIDRPKSNEIEESTENKEPNPYLGTTDPRIMQQKILMEEQAANNQIASQVPESMQSNFKAAVINEAMQQTRDNQAYVERQQDFVNAPKQQAAYNAQPDFYIGADKANAQGLNNESLKANMQPQYAKEANEQPQPQYASPFQNAQQGNIGYQGEPTAFTAPQDVKMQQNRYAAPQTNNEAMQYNQQWQQPQQPPPPQPQPQYASPFQNAQQGGFNYQPQQSFNSVPRYADNEGLDNTGYNYGSLTRPQGNTNIYGKRIISVYSTKGGSGKSSVTKELACAFVRDDAKINGRKPRVLLVDLDFSASDLHTIFSIPTSPNIMSLVNLMRRDIQSTGSIPPYDKYTIDRFIRKNVHEGLDILVGPQMDQDKALFTVEIVTAICKNLRACDYDIIIYDNAPSHEELTLRVLEQSDDVVVICTCDTTTIAELQSFFRIERERSFDASKLKLVLNNVPTDTKSLDILPQDLFEYFDIRNLGQLPHDDNVRLSNNASYSLLLDDKKTPYVKAMMEIANGLVPVYKTEKKAGLLSRLFSKRK